MMDNYTAALKVHILSLRAKLKAMEHLDHSIDATRNEWMVTSDQVDALEAELNRYLSVSKEQDNG